MSRASNALPIVTLMIFGSLVLGGCSIKNPKYPATWPTVNETLDVEKRIVGTYECQGEIIDNNIGLWAYTSLSSFTYGGEIPAWCDLLEISHPDSNELQLRYISAGSKTLIKALKRDEDYSVDDGWIVFKSRGFSDAKNVVAVHESVTIYLAVNASNDLIAKAKNSTIGLVFTIFPSGSFGTRWGKFKRVK